MNVKLPPLDSLPVYPQLEALPAEPGVYLMYDRDDALIYIGKSVDIRARVRSHYAARYRERKEARLASLCHRIEARPTAGELGALLLENALIKQHLPPLNRRQRRVKKWWSLALGADAAGYQTLSVATDVDPAAALRQGGLLGLFKSKRAARSWLESAVSEHRLCPRLAGLESGRGRCFRAQLGQCLGACGADEPPADYNARVQAALAGQRYRAWRPPGPIAVQERGATASQWFRVEHWCLQGWADRAFEWRPPEVPDGGFDRDACAILQRFFRLRPAGLTFYELGGGRWCALSEARCREYFDEA